MTVNDPTPGRRTPRRWLRFSLGGLLFLVFCLSGFMAGNHYGFDRGYSEGLRFRDSEECFVKKYDVSDLISMSPPGPRYTFDPQGGGFGGPIAVEPPPADAPLQPDFDAFINMIIETLVVESWDVVGGPGAIREYINPDGRCFVIVRQNKFGHDEIAKLLASLRENDVTTESNGDE